MPSNVLQCTGQPLAIKNYPAPGVSSAKVEKTWFKIRFQENGPCMGPKGNDFQVESRTLFFNQTCLLSLVHQSVLLGKHLIASDGLLSFQKFLLGSFLFQPVLAGPTLHTSLCIGLSSAPYRFSSVETRRGQQKEQSLSSPPTKIHFDFQLTFKDRNYSF